MKWVDDNEPAWRQVAYWLTVVAFFTVPLVAFVVDLTHPTAEQGQFRYLADYHRTLAALLAAQFGLNSWDKRLNNHQPPAKKEVGK